MKKQETKFENTELRLAQLSADAAKTVAHARLKVAGAAVLTPLALIGALSCLNEETNTSMKDPLLLYMAGMMTATGGAFIGMGYADLALAKQRVKQLEQE